jgi:hypothetical protein
MMHWYSVRTMMAGCVVMRMMGRHKARKMSCLVVSPLSYLDLNWTPSLSPPSRRSRSTLRRIRTGAYVSGRSTAPATAASPPTMTMM